MQIVAYFISAILGFLGLVFVVGSQGQPLRIVVGVVLFIAAGVLVYLVRVQPKPQTTTIVQKIDLSGNVNLQELTCKSCGGKLSEKSIGIRAGAIFVNCEYCGTAYQLEEEPKW